MREAIAEVVRCNRGDGCAACDVVDSEGRGELRSVSTNQRGADITRENKPQPYVPEGYELDESDKIVKQHIVE